MTTSYPDDYDRGVDDNDIGVDDDDADNDYDKFNNDCYNHEMITLIMMMMMILHGMYLYFIRDHRKKLHSFTSCFNKWRMVY